MKYRIKEVTLKNGGKLYYPQWSRLGLLWSGFVHSYGGVRRSRFIENPVFHLLFISMKKAKEIISEYENQILAEKGREEESVKYLDL